MKRLALILALVAAPVFAVEPDEVLDDPALEARARALSEGLRCPVCQNESIDASHADLARDLRLLLRERLVAGDSDDEAVQYIVDRYGEFVLLRPDTSGVNMVLWLSAPILLLLGLGMGWMVLRDRSRTPGPNALSAEEEARLAALMSDPAADDPEKMSK